MTWALETSNKRIVLGDGHVIGRSDFPDDPALSREHLGVSLSNGEALINDLDSNNGVYLNDERLRAQVPTPLRPGDEVRIGSTTFDVVHHRAATLDPFKLKPIVTMLAFVGLSLAAFARPELDYGRAVGYPLLVASEVALLLVTFVASAFWWQGLRGFGFSSLVTPVYAASTILTAAGLMTAVLTAADLKFDLKNRMVRARVEYFCDHHFDHARCVDNVNACPDCVLGIERWRRARMAQRLKTSTDGLEAGVRRAGETMRQPAAQH